MYLRCPDCLMASWTDALCESGLRREVACPVCGRRHGLRPADGLEHSVRGHYHATLEFSNAKGIDMPGAYAVLLGLMTLSRALRIQGHAAAVERTARAAEADTAPERPEMNGIRGALLSDMDPEFLRAISRGRLSAKEVAQRGDHDAYVHWLGDRHRLPPKLAVHVAANRISLREALARLPAPEAPRRTRTPASGAQKGFVLGVAATLLLVTAWSSWSRHFEGLDSSPAGRRAPTPTTAVRESPQRRQAGPARDEVRRTATDISRDDAGRVVRLEGPDPQAVLLAYCGSAPPGSRLEPVGLRTAGAGAPAGRVGIFRDLTAFESLQAIRIRQDHRSRRWIAGDGRAPIPVDPPP